MILIDTNVLLDVLTKRDRFYVSAAAIWSAAETGPISGAISAISFNNTYYIMRKYGGESAARKAVAALRGIFTVVPLDARIINLAIDSDLGDFEDAIQLHSAVRVGARYLVTRNPADFATEVLSVVCPDEYLAILEVAADATT